MRVLESPSLPRVDLVIRVGSSSANISAGLPPFEAELSSLSLAQRSPMDAAWSGLSSPFPTGAGITYTLAGS